jgi:hypothetical protein
VAAPSLDPGPAHAERGKHGTRQARHDRRGAEDGADKRDPPDDEGGQGAEGGTREHHGPPVLVEAPAQGGDRDRDRDEGEAGQDEDEDAAPARNAAGDVGGREEYADAHDAVDAQGQQREATYCATVPRRAVRFPALRLRVRHQEGAFWTASRARRSIKPAARAARSGREARTTCSFLRMRPVAIDAETIQCRQAQGRGEGGLAGAARRHLL